MSQDRELLPPSLHQRLLKLREGLTATEKPIWFLSHTGLCANYNSMCTFLGEHPPSLEKLCGGKWKEWPLFSGEREYPVPAGEIVSRWPDMSNANYAYDYAMDMYDTSTDYGRDRMALLDYLIERTKEQ